MNDRPDTFEDLDPEETREWIESLDAVIAADGPERAHFLLDQLVDTARRRGTYLPYRMTTAYVNTIPVHLEEKNPGDAELEWRIRSMIRWNAMAMVLRANQGDSDLGGHIASFASAATLYDVGFNHFFHAPTEDHDGDLVYIQGHSAPGIYARAFLEGRLTEEQLDGFRSEVDGKGLSSYPHPWLMPGFWQFPTVSMGLGPLMAAYQARFLKYLGNRGLVDTKGRKVWAFMGDGEMDEPESTGGISMAAREGLDNLIFVINCNLQRLDGPVRGNGKVIQDLEGLFRGAGWNVIKVIWGAHWDPLLARDTQGLLRRRMQEAVDGDYQNYKANDGAYVREYFFGKYPELKAMVANMSDEDIWRLNRGGHDPQKVYAAYHEAMNAVDKPTVILAKTIKGYGMGEAGEARNITHQQKKMDVGHIKQFRDRFKVPIPDDQLEDLPYYMPAQDSRELRYMKARREALGGDLPARRRESQALKVPGLDTFSGMLEGTGERKISTTMAFVRILAALVRDKEIGKRVVPIVPDEARTFGMEGMFRQLGIYSAVGQLYTPVDSDQLAWYKEDIKGQILEEGINEAGAFCSWMAAATSYSSSDYPMIPFYIYYSMFGFQRVGDFAWAAGDMRARGFLMGATAGRTTLNGEGLQHEDGHSHILCSTIPNCVSYDPTYAYELAVIIQHGMRRMYADQDDVYFYITLMNENYAHPAIPKGAEEGILRGMHLLHEGKKGSPRVQLLGSGTILREVEAAAEMLKMDFGIEADVWSATSFNGLRRDGLDVTRHNRLHPDVKARTCWVEDCLDGRDGPVIAATDYIKAFPDQIREWVRGTYVTLGTDGFGRSDTRENLRRFFEVDRNQVAYAAVLALAGDGGLPKARIKEARKKYGIDPKKPNPVTA
ncbi:MAG: pyruvate dehydrogenase (acetyl-transferring), homodimeric type [Gammaproteobacteria bacterium]|nr:MAG: pyruvate dehydrogenase (acetyl-transferring), homodimeric type [Gammaproteobacteria bacterium]